MLGVIWQLGPCSAYDVRRHLGASPSAQWSGSAGAIYPLVRRLERRRLLRARDLATGRRRRRVYAVTPAGRRVLQAWVGPPLGAESITVAHDPLRARARFLGVLPPAQRAAWVAAAIGALEEVGRRVHAWQADYGGDDPFLALTTRSGELDVASRREWLRELGALLDQPPKRTERGRGG